MAFTGGAPQVVADVFDRMWMMAQSRTELADAAINRAVAETEGWTPLTAPQLMQLA